MRNTEETLAHKELRSSERGKALIEQAEAEAASFLFDLNSGETNADVAEELTPHQIYIGVVLAGALTFEVSGNRYTVEPYYQGLSEDDALAMLQDVRSQIECNLIDLAVTLQDSGPEYFPGATKSEILDVCAPDIFGDYDVPEDVEEWAWIEEKACFSHRDNGKDGVWEFVVNVAYDLGRIPARLKPVLKTASESACGYILFHQGT